MALTDIREINQEELAQLLNFNIKHGFNLMVFGPSGSGKSEMAMQAAKKCNSVLSWCNLSVNERPDIQGYPKANSEGLITEFTYPHYIPLPETQYLQEKMALESTLKILRGQNEFGDVEKQIQDRINQIAKCESVTQLKTAMPFIQSLDGFTSKQFVKYVSDMDKVAQDSTQKITIMFDEADKAPHDVLQPLLELLQFHTLNGKKTAIHSCLVTCNLPDENAHTEKLSHAITNRCFIYKLNVDFDAWRKWAVPHKVHPLIVGFLGSNKDMILKKPNNNDDTAYAHPTPRAWTQASEALYRLEQDPEFASLGDNNLTDLKTTVISGKVGIAAALKFEVWLKHYRNLDPVIEKIVDKGEKPNWGKLNLEEKLVCAIGVCSRLNPELKPNNEEKIKKYVKNIFTWIEDIEIDIQTAGVRNALDYESLQAYGIADYKEATRVFKKIKDKTDNS